MPKLGLEAVGGLAERGSHDAGVADDHVERLAGRHQLVGRRPDAGQGGQVQLDKFDAAAVLRIGADDLGRGLRLCEVACGADHFGAVGGEDTRGLDAEAGGDAGYEDAFAA